MKPIETQGRSPVKPTAPFASCHRGYFSLGATALLAVLCTLTVSGCVIGFAGGCAPDYEEHSLELWSVNVQGSDESLIYDGWPVQEYGSLQIYDYSLLVPSRSGNAFYYHSDNHHDEDGIYLFDITTGTPAYISNTQGRRDYVLSRNQQWVAFAKHVGSRQIWITSTDGAITRPITSDTTANHGNPVWLSNNRIAYVKSRWKGGADTGIWIENLHSGERQKLTDDILYNFDLSFDGSRLLYQLNPDDDGPAQPTIYLRKGESEAELATGHSATFGPNDDNIVYTSDAYELWVMNTDGSAKTRLSQAGKRLRGFDVSEDGSSVVYVADNDLWYISISGTYPIKLVDAEEYVGPLEEWESIDPVVRSPLFSRDGSKVFYLIGRSFFDNGC